MPWDSYSLNDPSKQLWYLPCMERIKLPIWDCHPAMQRFRDKCTDMKHHLLVRQFHLNKELYAKHSTFNPGDLCNKTREMEDRMYNNATVCSLECAGAMMLLCKPFLDFISLHRDQVDFYQEKIGRSLFWAALVTMKAQIQHPLQRKQSLQL